MRWLVGTALAVVLLLATGYRQLTDPERLKQRFVAALELAGLDNVSVGEVVFVPWNRLEVADLLVSPATDGSFYRRLPGPDALPLLRVSSARVRCDLSALMLGRVRATDVRFEHAALATIFAPTAFASAADVEEMDDGARLVDTWLRRTADWHPAFTIEQGDWQIFVMEQGRPQLLQRLLLRIEGRPTLDGYAIRVDRRPPRSQPWARLSWSRSTGELNAALDWIELDHLSRLLSPDLRSALRNFVAAGRVRLDRGVIRSPASGSPYFSGLDLSFADVRGTLPIEEAPLAPADRFLKLTNAALDLRYTRESTRALGIVHLALRGDLRGATAEATCSMRADSLAALLMRGEGAQGAQPASSVFENDDCFELHATLGRLELPAPEAAPAFVGSSALPGPVRSALRDYAPVGDVDLEFHIVPPDQPGPDGNPLTGRARVSGTIEGHGARCRYRHFPYDFVDIHGPVRIIAGRILLDGLTAHHGTACVQASGVVNNSQSWTGFDLTFSGREIALDADLHAALPENYRGLWQRTAPRGFCDAVVRVQRAEGTAATGPLMTDVTVSAQLKNGSLALGDGRRLERAAGRIEIQGGAVTVRDLRGYVGQAALRLDGSLRVAPETGPSEMHVEATDWPIDQVVWLESESTPDATHVRVRGDADVRGQFSEDDPAQSRAQFYTVELRRGELAGRDPNRPWAIASGLIRVHDDRHEVESLRCSQGDAQLEVSGWLPAGRGKAQELNLTLRATSPAIDALYPQFAPRAWAAALDEFGLSGRGTIAVHLTTDGASPVGSKLAEINAEVERAEPRAVPLPLRDVQAELVVAPDHFRVVQATATLAPEARIRIAQPADGAWRANEITAEFDVLAENLRLDAEFAAALPEGWGRLFERIAMRGTCDLHLPRAALSSRAGQRAWQLEGDLHLREAQLRVGFDLDVRNAAIVGLCSLGVGGVVAGDTRLSIERGTLAGRPIAQWEGALRWGPDGRWVQLDDCRGRLCDGAAEGSLWIDPRTAEYELSLRLLDIAAVELLPPPPEHPQRLARGRIAGDIWLRGRGTEASSRQGGGDIWIAGASFVQMPVLASVFRLRGASAGSETVDRARLRFLWQGRQIQLNRVDIYGRDLRLVGTGTWNLHDDTVHLTLWAASPATWPALERASTLLEAAGQELVQYRIEGTLSAPKVTAQPLRRLNEALRRLLREE